MEHSNIKKGKGTLTEQVAGRIVSYICDNRLGKGDRLPNEKELMKQMNVSRCTIREAVRLLSSRNIVVVERGRGTFVADSAGLSEDPLGLEFIYDRKKLTQDLLELRIMLEPPIAACCAVRATQAEKDEILELAQKVEFEILRGRDHSAYDVAFHCKIAECTKNDIIKILLPEITKGVQLFVASTGTRLLQMTMETHRQIAFAIQRGDTEAAHRAMLQHLEYNREVLEQILMNEDERD